MKKKEHRAPFQNAVDHEMHQGSHADEWNNKRASSKRTNRKLKEQAKESERKSEG